MGVPKFVIALMSFGVLGCNAVIESKPVDSSSVVGPAVIEVEAVSVEIDVVDHNAIHDVLVRDIPLDRGRTWDVCDGILKLSEDMEVDPRIIVEEFLELFRVTVKLQPLFLEGKEGGIHRAFGITWDVYSEAMKHRDVKCEDIELKKGEESFDADINSVPRVNPYVVLSMGYRESRLLHRTEVGYTRIRGKKVTDCRWCRGGKGERGMYQFMPRGWIQRRFLPRDCSPFDRLCSVRGAVKSLVYIRCMCIREFGEECNIDTYVAGYGMSRLPSPARARHSRGPRRARSFLCSVYADCDDVWPISHDDDFALSL